MTESKSEAIRNSTSNENDKTNDCNANKCTFCRKKSTTTPNEKAEYRGKIQFGTMSRMAQFIRSEYIKRDNITDVFKELYYNMITFLGFDEPDVIISINCGHEETLNMNKKQQAEFKLSLINVAKSSKTWIFTRGCNFGVSKLIGEAAFGLLRPKKAIINYTVIGFMNSLCFHDNLMGDREFDKCPCRWVKFPEDTDSENRTIKLEPLKTSENSDGSLKDKDYKYLLDQNHDAFIWFNRGENTKEYNLRLEFEKYVSAKANCDVVHVVVGSSKKVTDMVKEASKKTFPSLIIYDFKTIGISTEEALRWRYNYPWQFDRDSDGGDVKSAELDENNSKEGTKLIHKPFRCSSCLLEISPEDALRWRYNYPWQFDRDSDGGNTKPGEPDKSIDENKKLNEGTNLIHKLRTRDIREYFGKVFLQALMSQERPKKKDDEKKFKLWLNYNRSYENSEFFVKDFLKQDSIEKALEEDQWQFVQLYLSNDMKIEPCSDILHDLYMIDMTKMERLGRYFQLKPTNLADYIDGIVDKLSKNILRPPDDKKKKSEEKLKEYRDIFLWSLLTEKWKMSKILWENGDNHMAYALVAALICKTLSKIAKKEGDLEAVERLNRRQVGFETMAEDILTEAFRLDQNLAHILLVRKLKNFHGMTCMSIAVKCRLFVFLANGACQHSLNRIWFGKIYMLTSMTRFLMNLPLALCTSKFAMFSVTNCVPCCEKLKKAKAKKKEEKINEKKDDYPNLKSSSSIEEHCGCGSKCWPSCEKSKVEKTGQDIDDYPNFKKRRCMEKHCDCDKRKGGCYFKATYKCKVCKHDRMGLCKAVGYYFRAPKTKCITAILSYLVFLAVFSYVCLVELKELSGVNSISGRQMELALYGFILSFMLEEIRKISHNRSIHFIGRFNEWITTRWNLYNVLLYSLFSIAVVLRYFLSGEHFIYPRTIYSVTCAMSYLRFLQFYYADKSIGPKVISIYKMLKDVFFFLSIYLLALLAYGILAQSLLFSNSKFDTFLLKNIVYLPYWQTYGDLHLEYVEGTEDQNGTDPTPNAIVTAGFAIYMLFTNIILMNLLIAMFQITLNSMEKNAYNIWTLIRYKLFEEYYMRPVLPPPLNIFELILFAFRGMHNNCSNLRNKKIKKEKSKEKKINKKKDKDKVKDGKNDKDKKKDKGKDSYRVIEKKDEFSLKICKNAELTCILFEKFCLDQCLIKDKWDQIVKENEDDDKLPQ